MIVLWFRYGRYAGTMSLYAFGQALFFFAIFALLVKPLGDYMARVFAGERTVLAPLLHPVETALYRLARIDPNAEMRWTSYAFSVLAFSLISGAANVWHPARATVATAQPAATSRIWRPT
jgi:K+-transporting ATPase A subunit